MDQGLLRTIPKVDDLLRLAQSQPEAVDIPHTVLLASVRQVLEDLRRNIIGGSLGSVPDQEGLAEQALRAAREEMAYRLRPIINATGIVLHTNLGRSILGEAVAEHVKQTAMAYSTLEYNVAEGARGSRHDLVAALLCRLTGCEDALVVNNNAAAVLLMLSALCTGKEVVVSRGELVEIGGSFRVPDIMMQGGALLREVGTTNKTRLSDYRDAVSPESTGALLKVHTSNFKVVGFTQEVSLDALAALADEQGIPLLYDLGSGCLDSLPGLDLGDEPTVNRSTAQGAHVVTFSGDKLLGGPQAGIIVGQRRYIQQMKRHPLARALRVCKLTLAALEATLRLYLDPQRAREHIPTLDMLSMSLDALGNKAEKLRDLAVQGGCHWNLSVVEAQGQVGGGSVPGQHLPSFALAVEPDEISLDSLEQALRMWNPPIVGRIHREQLLLDVRTIRDKELPVVAQALYTVSKEGSPA